MPQIYKMQITDLCPCYLTWNVYNNFVTSA